MKRREPGLRQNLFCTSPILIECHSEALNHLLPRPQPACPGCLLRRLVVERSIGTIQHTVSETRGSRVCVDLVESVGRGGMTFWVNTLHDGGLWEMPIQHITLLGE